MAEIVKIKKDGVIQYPITKPECVIDENGKNVLQLIKENGGGSTPDLSEYLTKEEFNRASEVFATADALEGKQDTIEDLDSIRSGAGKGATAVQPSTLTGYATTQQLTELSAEVSGLSERIDNLPSGESSVFVATYGETTLQEIRDAIAAKKVVVCYYDNKCYVLSIITSNDVTLVASKGNYLYALSCNYKNEWSGAAYIYSHELKSLANGNAQITIAGKTAEVATPQYVENAIQQSGTPSGDPMHYMFEAAGATYNATDADIPMVGVYGDSYVHKAKHWHLNELGDITNEEMRQIYLYANLDNGAKGVAKYLAGIGTRTNIATWSSSWSGKIKDQEAFAYAYNIIVARLRDKEHYIDTNASFAFTGCTALQKILPTLDATSTTSFNGAFDSCNNLREVRIKNIKVAIKFDKSPLISKASILYLIQNSAATSAMVITLHADAYARLAEDADIVAALAEKTNVSLAK